LTIKTPEFHHINLIGIFYSMSSFSETVKQLTPEIYTQFKQAIESGKWPDGRLLDDQQKGLVMEAIIIYENATLPKDQRTGFNPDMCRSKAEGNGSADESDILRFEDERSERGDTPPTQH